MNSKNIVTVLFASAPVVMVAGSQKPNFFGPQKKGKFSIFKASTSQAEYLAHTLNNFLQPQSKSKQFFTAADINITGPVERSSATAAGVGKSYADLANNVASNKLGFRFTQVMDDNFKCDKNSIERFLIFNETEKYWWAVVRKDKTYWALDALKQSEPVYITDASDFQEALRVMAGNWKVDKHFLFSQECVDINIEVKSSRHLWQYKEPIAFHAQHGSTTAALKVMIYNDIIKKHPELQHDKHAPVTKSEIFNMHLFASNHSEELDNSARAVFEAPQQTLDLQFEYSGKWAKLSKPDSDSIFGFDVKIHREKLYVKSLVHPEDDKRAALIDSWIVSDAVISKVRVSNEVITEAQAIFDALKKHDNVEVLMEMPTAEFEYMLERERFNESRMKLETVKNKMKNNYSVDPDIRDIWTSNCINHENVEETALCLDDYTGDVAHVDKLQKIAEKKIQQSNEEFDLVITKAKKIQANLVNDLKDVDSKRTSGLAHLWFVLPEKYKREDQITSNNRVLNMYYRDEHRKKIKEAMNKIAKVVNKPKPVAKSKVVNKAKPVAK